MEDNNNELIIRFIQVNPGATVNEVMDALHLSYIQAYNRLSQLRSENKIRRQQAKDSNNHLIYKYYLGGKSSQQETCEQKLAAQKQDEETKKECSKKNIDDFTAREMMQALTKKGFSGELRTTISKEIAFEDLTEEQFHKLKSEGFKGLVTVSRLYEFALNGAEQPANNEI